MYREYLPCPRNSSHRCWADSFETLQVLLGWYENMQVFFFFFFLEGSMHLVDYACHYFFLEVGGHKFFKSACYFSVFFFFFFFLSRVCI